MQARWYDPRTGQFLSLDPMSFAAGDSNLFRYVGNDAVNVVDPNGMNPNQRVDRCFTFSAILREYLKATGVGKKTEANSLRYLPENEAQWQEWFYMQKSNHIKLGVIEGAKIHIPPVSKKDILPVSEYEWARRNLPGF